MRLDCVLIEFLKALVSLCVDLNFASDYMANFSPVKGAEILLRFHWLSGAFSARLPGQNFQPELISSACAEIISEAGLKSQPP